MNLFLKEIQEQPEALLQTWQYYESPEGMDALSQIATSWDSGIYDKIIFTGMGSSYFIAGSAAGLLNAHGISAFALNAGELLHYQSPLITQKTLLICISQSGESYEVIKLIEKVSERTTIFSICNEEDSTLVRLSHHSLLSKAGKEEMTSTKTFISAYLVAYLLVKTLCREKINRHQCHELITGIKYLVNGNTPWMGKAIELIEGSTFIQLIGRGSLFASASQSALMFMEATHTPASALLGGEFRHGPLEMVKEGFIAIAFTHSQSATYQQSLTLIKDTLKYKGKVILIADSEITIQHENLCLISVPCDDTDLFAIPGIVPVQLLINTWAARQGMTPGIFTHGAKVTAIE